MPPIEEVIGYSFRDKDLLRTALTHKSYAAEKSSADCNERLEFLGDSVLGLAVARYLYGEHPGKDEGYLSKLKSYLVSRQNLAAWARAINLGE
ncbi:MAG: ribonuclease III domain-containing protein, partial [Elusimicrobiales bacterium]|nr:ribonuclease III domain-containing protein [Elusimicrobiales bacterium]